MANSPQRPDARLIRPSYRAYGLPVTAYDRVASMLISLLMLIGAAVLILFVLWLTSKIFASQAAVPVILEQIGEGGGLGDSMDLETDVQEIGQETDFEDPELKDVLTAVADAVAAKAALTEDPALFELMDSTRGGPKGDGRAPGSGMGKPGKRRHWEVRFLQGNTLGRYAAQLDYFRIELGVLMPGNSVEYAYNLAKRTPDRRSGPADQEQRYYLTWRRGGLREADIELLNRAGISTDERLILKFLPPQLETELIQKERARAGSNVDKIRATYFGIRTEGSGYAFYVIEQTYN